MTTPLGISGIIFIIIGIVMAIVGIVLIIAYQNRLKPWYVWFFLILGIVLGITGGIMLAFALSKPNKKEYKMLDVPDISDE